MGHFNRLDIVGTAGKDAELSYTESGKPVAKFSVAVNQYKGKDPEGNPLYNTQWFNCTAWNGLAETVQKLVTKGNTYFVSGPVSLRIYKKHDGTMGTSLDVVARDVVPVGKAANFENGSTPASTTASKTGNLDSSPLDNLDLDELEDHPF